MTGGEGGEGTYVARREELAVGRERQRAHYALVPFERCALRERLPVPRIEPHLLVLLYVAALHQSTGQGKEGKGSHTSPPTATNEPEVAIALGAYLGLRPNTFWFERTASMLSTSATNTVESPPTARPALGWAAVKNDAGLPHVISNEFKEAEKTGCAYV